MSIPSLHSPRNWRGGRGKLKRRVIRSSAPLFKAPRQKTYRVQVNSYRKKITQKLWQIVWSKIFWKRLFLIGVVGVLFLAILVVYYSKDLPSPNKVIDRSIAQSTKIFDRTGEKLLYEVSGQQKRTLVELKDIPQEAIWATISVEDKKFYQHGGISLRGTSRSILVDIFTGSKAQGGSTLTQQFVKNAILTNEKKISRKIKEWVLAYRIEQKFSKDEILKMYFNEIPYGSNAYGIEAAANYYFGKSAKDLVLAESATLAALTQAPSYYSPYGSHKDRLIARQQFILDQMVAEKYINQEQADQAKKYELQFTNRLTNITAPHFVMMVKEYLAAKYGDQLVEQGGLKVITTLDVDAQKAAEEAVAGQAEKNVINFNANNAALVALEVNSSQVIALVGSKDYFNDDIAGQVNVAIQPRQPGSSFKPIVYLTGFTRGFTPDSILFDLNTVFKADPKDYAPKNYDLKEHGPVTIRQALAGSLNIPAVKMLYLAGVENVLDLADKFGYTTLKDRSRFGLSLVLGGGEVKLIEHVNAYATLAREGIKKDYNFILAVTDPTGKELEKYEENNGERIVEVEQVRMLQDIMQDNSARAFIFGESNYLTLPDRPVAAKTGTTNDYHDAWTIGFTPYQVAAGVWVGNSDNATMKRGADGSVIAAPIWQSFMKKYLASKEIIAFTKPTYTNSDKAMIGGFIEGGTKIKIDKFTGKRATENTPADAIEERVYKQVHNILYFVDKSDPLGPIPTNPQSDPQYAGWEEPVRKWAQEHNIINEVPPEDFDDIHQASDKPSVSILSPADGQEINANKFSINISAEAPRGISQIKIFLNDQEVGVLTNKPYNTEIKIPYGISNGSYHLIAKAYDDLLNTSQSDIVININREEYIKATWISPSAGTTLKQSDFPYTLQLGVDNPELLDQVDFYYREENSGQTHWINFTKSVSNSLISINWNEKPNKGVYKVYPVFTDKNRESIAGREIVISIED